MNYFISGNNSENYLSTSEIKVFKIKKAFQVIGKLLTGFLQTSCTFVQATQLLFSEAEYNFFPKIHISLEF